MKKSLIALAVLATAGTAFAQSTVTLSGKLRFAYEATDVNTSGATAKANGLKVTDGDFALTAVEDLGGGLKATAFMNVQSRGRDTAISGRDAYLKLDGGFGSVLIGAVEAGNGIIGLGGAGAPVYGMDGTVIAAASNVDILKYTTPQLIPGLTLSAAVLDATASLGMESAATTQDATVLYLNYGAGPLAVAADYTKWGKNAAALPTADKRVRASASYDLGMAKLGFGYEVKTVDTLAAADVDTKDMLVGVSVPMGAVTLGFNYATSQTDGQVKVKGYDLGAKYDLSKRTYVAFHYQNVDNRAGTTINATSDNNKYRIQLAHAF